MNRTAVGLAVGAGYVLGRTKKMKLAFAVGTMVAGKKLQLSPKAVMDMVRTQLDKNPQFQELGGQLRDDFRGVGKAATGAILERQMEGLASRLHSSTAGVRDRLEGGTPQADEHDESDERDEFDESDEPRDAEDRADKDDTDDADDADDTDDADDADDAEEERPAPRKRAPAKKSGQSAQSGRRKPEQGTRSRGTTAKKAPSTGAKKAAGTARRAPRSAAKGDQDNG